VEPADPHEYLGTVALGEHLERLDEPLRAPFVDAVLDRLDEPVVDYVRLNILARSAS
jgi:trans-aconitate 2-methyltransferase